MNRQTGGATGSSNSAGSRGQSETLGFILIFSVVILGAVAVVALGAVALDDTGNSLSNDRAEKSMTQFASEGALVALGGSDTQRISFPRSGSDQYAIDADEGWMEITSSNTSSATVLANVTLGTVTYEGTDGTRIAYQGGGVWRTSDRGGGSAMISPPEFHYRAATLTLPVVNITGGNFLDNEAVISHERTDGIYPDLSNGYVNPLQNGSVNVTVGSKYYRAWGEYFEERTEGGVSYDDANQEVTVELIVPFQEEVDDPLVATATGPPEPINVKGTGNWDPVDEKTGVSYPSADETIEAEVGDCKSGACKTSFTQTDIDDSGTYFFSSTLENDVIIKGSEFSGNVSLVVDGNFEPDIVKVKDMEKDETVEIYVNRSFDIKSAEINVEDGYPGNLTTYVHSQSDTSGGQEDVQLRGGTRYFGLLYAPESDCALRGGGGPDPNNLQGAMICETIEVKGGSSFEVGYDPAVQLATIPSNADASFITYLHVSEHKVTVDSE